MDDKVREELSSQLDSIMEKLWTMKKNCETLMVRVNYGEREMPEDASIVLSEMDDKVGDALDAWCESFDYLSAY